MIDPALSLASLYLSISVVKKTRGMKYGVWSKIVRPAIVVIAVPFCDEIFRDNLPFKQGEPYLLKGYYARFLRLSRALAGACQKLCFRVRSGALPQISPQQRAI